jgi:hypothetical protein
MLVLLYRDLVADGQLLQQEQPLQVARNTKIINADSEEPKYVINIRQMAKFVVALGEKVSPTDIEEGMRVGYERLFCLLMSCFFSFQNVNFLGSQSFATEIPNSNSSATKNRSHCHNDDCGGETRRHLCRFGRRD